MPVSISCPSWTENAKNQTPCEAAQEVAKGCSYTCATIYPPTSEQAFIPGGLNVTACTCSWASYNLFSACMFCASSSPSLVSWDEWTANCPANLSSTTTYFPSSATLPSNTSIPCYAGYNPRSWPNGTFSAVAASDIAANSHSDLTGTVESCASSPSSSSASSPSSSSASSPSSSSHQTHKTPVGAIAGGVVGGVLLLLLVCGCILFVAYRRRRRARTSPEIIRSNSPHLDDKPVKDVYLSPSSPHDSLSPAAFPKTMLAADSAGKLTRAGIADVHPVATSALEPATDDALADGLCSASVPGLHIAPQGQTAGVHVLDGRTDTSQNVQAIGVHVKADHAGTAISELCTPLRGRPTAVGYVQEHEISVPTLERTIESASLEAVNSDIAIPRSHRLSQELIGEVSREAEPREELLAIASVSQQEIVEDTRECDDRELGFFSISDVATEATQPKAEQVGNLLAQLYIEESPSTDVAQDNSVVLQTVSRAEAEAVQALLVSDTRDRVIIPVARRSSLPYIETRKAPVSEDLVKRVVYTYLMDPATRQSIPPSRTHSLKLDLLFILDLTGSQQPYIDSVKSSINTICAEILGSDHVNSAQPGDLRVAFIGFRDHPPQDDSFVTREWDFVSDITRIHANLRSLPGANGGGDGPEAVTAALARALTMRWRNDCNRVTVLVSDAPPHGIGSQGDYWPYGVPGVPDPLDLAREMLRKKITLHFVACEPSLSSFHNALDFYRGLTRITAGIVVPLLDARVMSTCIIGSALESLAIQDLINEYRETLDELVPSREPSLVVKYLHALMRVRGRTANQLIMEDIYVMSDDRKENVEIWSSARSLADAKARLQSYY
ncbi:hypothetical protein BDR07DRAFT_1401840 [Suillus spraguei]|nr:hypothetical protein BDR07DRAFT_1401840 [Suillus spraguei]